MELAVLEEDVVDSSRVVNYFNLTLEVPARHNYIAIDKEGSCISYEMCPSVTNDYWESEGEEIHICNVVILDNNDWRSSLQFIGGNVDRQFTNVHLNYQDANFCIDLDDFKIVDYFGLTMAVRRKYNYIATDADGNVFAYEKEPKLREDFFEVPSPSEAMQLLTSIKAFSGYWQKSLIKC